MKKLLFLMLILASINVFSQIPMLNKRIAEFGSAFNISMHFSTDTDGDGDVDIFTLHDGSVLSWYENVGGGEFAFPIIFSNGIIQTTRGMFAADLNADGNKDLIISSYNDGKLYWFENYGNGNFSSEILIDGNVPVAYAVNAQDLDLDGDLDVVSGSYGGGYVHWYENDGTGNFITEKTVCSFTQVEGLHMADIDNDGDVDAVVMRNLDYRVSWYKNDGLGNFSFGSTPNNGQATTGTSRIGLTDSNNDGLRDLVICSDAGNIRIHLNTGVTFSTTGTSFPSYIDVSNVISEDMNNDGLEDLVISHSPTNVNVEARWFESNGDGTYQNGIRISERANNCVVSVADVDNDGYIDVISRSTTSKRLTWLKNTGPAPTFAFHFSDHIYISSNYYSTGYAVRTADMDDDGDLDIVSASSYNSSTLNDAIGTSIMFYENLGNGIYANPDSIAGTATLLSTTSSLKQTRLFDFDNDGDIDITTLRSTGFLYWAENLGGNNFAPLASAGPGFSSIDKYTLHDMDNDGDNDLIIVKYASNSRTYSWVENIGGSNYTGASHVIGSQVSGSSLPPYWNGDVLVEDIDNDNDFDIITNDEVNGVYIFYENTGSGNFAPAFTLNSNLANGKVGDMDNDGDLDLVTVGGISFYATIQYQTNDGSGNFTTPTTLYTGSIAGPIVLGYDIGDLDGDTFKDIIFFKYDTLYWMKNNGGISFEAPELMDIVCYGGQVLLKDIQNDGSLDILYENTKCAEISWLENCSNSNQVQNVNICGGESYFFDGQNLNVSGIYQDTIINPAGGCDTYITLNLDVMPIQYSSISVTACDTYTSPSGKIWNNSNIYLDTIQSVSSCDSIITIDLTINNSNNSIDSHDACESFTWIDGNTYTSSNSTATHILTNQFSCDSIITLNLTIYNNASVTETQYSCENYTWRDGITYNASNNIATHIVNGVATNGCDSVYHLDLTIYQPDYTTDIVNSCNEYTWIDGNNYTSSNTTATWDLINENGCDSIVTLNLTISQPSSNSIDIQACEDYLSPSGNYLWTSSGQYMDTIQNFAGCDSVLTISLTIGDVLAPIANIGSLSDITSECSVTSLTAPTATDNCAGSIAGTHNATLPITSNGTTVVTWTYDDGNGNTSTQNQNVVIDDVTAPVANIGSLSDVNAQCSVTSLTAPTATDNCAGSITGTHNATLPITMQVTTVVTWTYDDGNGNTSTQTQNVIIDDVTAPVGDVAILADINSECEVTPTVPNATDNCAGTVTGTPNVSFPITTQGTFTITWTYDDGNGNTSTQTQNVTVDDVTAPVADNAILTTVNAECSVSPTAPTATDNCVGSVTGTPDVSFPISSQGTTVVTWSYNDGNGNISTQTQNVIITDVTAPIADIVTLSDITSECEVTPTAPAATDNCVGVLTGTPDVAFPITAQGTTTVTWTYDDGNGNTSTQTQDVIITPIDNGITQVDALTLSADATGYNYQWVDCDNGNQAINGATNQTFVATVNGNYAVEIDNGTCTVVSACLVIDEVGIKEIWDAGLVEVYPNPTTGIVYIESKVKIESIELVDALGQIINVYSANENKIEINTTPGVYFLRIMTEGSENIIRVVKQ